MVGQNTSKKLTTASFEEAGVKATVKRLKKTLRFFAVDNKKPCLKFRQGFLYFILVLCELFLNTLTNY